MRRLTLVGILVLISFIAFDTLAIATAMPAIAADLDAGGAYSLAFAMFLAGSLAGQGAAGGWTDLKGPRPAFYLGVVFFIVGMVGCALATDLPFFLLARAGSGIGAGMLTVGIYVLIAAIYDETERPKVFGYLSAAWVLPALIGPGIAGWLATEVSWRAVFWLGVPFALVAAAILTPGARSAPPPTVQANPIGVRRRAVRSIVLACAATVLLWSLESNSIPVWARVVLGVGSIAALARLLPALVPPGTLRARRGLPSVIGFRALIGGCYFGAEAYIPLAVHSQRGMSLTEAGVALTAASIGWWAGAHLQGRDKRVGADRAGLLVRGGAHVAIAIAALPLVMLSAVTPWLVVLIWTFAATGMGMSIATTSVIVMALSNPEEQGRDGAALQIAEGLGSVFGVGLAGLVYAIGRGHGHDPAVFSTLWLLLAAVASLTVVAGRRVRT